MRILYVSDYYYPELGYQVAFLPKEYARLGHEVFIITSDRHSHIIYEGDAAKSLLGERIKKPGFFIEGDIKVWRLKTLFEIDDTLWMKGLEKKIRELKPDIVHVIGITTLPAIRIALLKLRCPKFKLIYNSYQIFIASASKWRIMYPIFRLLCSGLIVKTADAIVAAADEAKIFANQKCGMPLNKIEIIYHGADNILFRQDLKARKEIREHLGINDEIIFIYTGKINNGKGVHLLVKSGIELMKKYGNLKILILGNGHFSYIEEMKKEIESSGLQNNFIWHELVPNNELYKFYSAADVAVWPLSVTISAFEAMSCNLPIIVSDVPAATERVSYSNGLIVRNGSIQELTKHIELMLTNPQLRIEMGANGRKVIEEKYNWTAIAKRFLELVEK